MKFEPEDEYYTLLLKDPLKVVTEILVGESFFSKAVFLEKNHPTYHSQKIVSGSKEFME